MRLRPYLSVIIALVAVSVSSATAIPEKGVRPSSKVRSRAAGNVDRSPDVEPARQPAPSNVQDRQAISLKAKSLPVSQTSEVPKAVKLSRIRNAGFNRPAIGTVPVTLKGPFGERTKEFPPAIASNFLKKHHRFFSLKSDLSDAKFSRSSESLAANHVAFQQVHNGIPVEGGRIRVHLFKDGRVQIAKGRLSKDLSPDMRSGVSEEEAVRIARRHLQVVGDLRGSTQAEQVVLPHPHPGFLAWKVSIPARQPCGDWIVMVHAWNGTVISAQDVRMFASGQGKVFDPNPVVTLQRTDLTDQNDSAAAVPESAYTPVTLEDLDGTGYLRGPYVDTALTSSRAYSPQLDFRYNRSQPEFEQVMIYFHIQEFQKYLRNDLGIFLDTRQVLADAHIGDEDNSWYSPFIRAIYFGDGGVDDAEDAYIVLHEYVHAVAYDILREPCLNTESCAIGEGTCDYFAASFFAGRGFMPEAFGQWDGIANTPIGVRRVDSDKVYPADMTDESHNDGEIWSSALWHLRSDVGGEVADRLVAESVFYLDGSSQFSDGLEALLLADDALYGGSHANAISTAFADRGILPLSLMSLGETRNGMLTTGDLLMPDGSYYDQYAFAALAGQTVKITLTSSEFDAYLLLHDPFFNTIAHGDDLPDGSSNAKVVLPIPYPGTYHIFANAYDQGETGEYSLSLSAASTSDGTPQSTSIAFSTQLSGRLGSGDHTLVDGTYFDEYSFSGHTGLKITVSMTSPNMDAYLVLYDDADNIVAEDDNGGPGADALIRYTLPYDGGYSIAANQALPSSGDYEILLTSSDPQLQLATIVSGKLETGDLKMSDDSYFDPCQFQAGVAETFSFKMSSADFDAYLIVLNPYGETVIEADDISASNTNSAVEEFRVDVPGTYFVIANSFGAGESGAYRLAVFPLSVTDADADGFSDRVEIAESTDPLDSSSVPPDADGDFIPDTMDPDDDNDGMPDLAEIAAGTNPRDPTSLFRVVALSAEPQGLTIRWASVPGHSYAVHRSPDLVNWSVAHSDIPSQGDVTVWTESDLGTGAANFYRIEALPPSP